MTLQEAKDLIEKEIQDLGFTIKYRKSITGCVFYDSKTCFMPEVKSRKSLYLACHELYHVLEKRKDKVYINELKAERFAHNKMRQLGFSVPRSMTKRAKSYVKHKVRKALRRGLQRINPEVKRYLRRI
jgi:hypothetical protein